MFNLGLIVLSIVFTVMLPVFTSCGDIKIKDNGNGNDIDADWQSEKKTEKKKKKKYVEVEEEEIVTTYTLRHPSGLTDAYIGGDYCDGIPFRNCYLGGAIIKLYESGKAVVSLEYIDSESEDKYDVTRDIVNDDSAFLVSDYVKIKEDDSIEPRNLWAVVNFDDLTLEILYDYTGDGPNELGTERLDIFEFEEK